MQVGAADPGHQHLQPHLARPRLGDRRPRAPRSAPDGRRRPRASCSSRAPLSQHRSDRQAGSSRRPSTSRCPHRTRPRRSAARPRPPRPPSARRTGAAGWPPSRSRAGRACCRAAGCRRSPGDRAFTRTPREAHSNASDLVIATTPALEALYAACCCGTLTMCAPDIDAMVTIRPDACVEHHPADPLAGQEHPGQVDPDGPLPDREAHAPRPASAPPTVRPRRPARRSGQRPCSTCCNRGVDRGLRQHVDLDERAGARLGATPVQREHLGAPLGQPGRHRLADTAGGSGDDDDGTVDPGHQSAVPTTV